jgi:hypothetical protein
MPLGEIVKNQSEVRTSRIGAKARRRVKQAEYYTSLGVKNS